MKLNKKVYSGFFIPVIAISAFLFLGAIKIHETGTIKADGSGSITFTYSANTSEIKKNNNLIGNFPFTQQTAKEYFSSANVKVKSCIVYKSKNDTSQTSVTIVIDFNNINNLSEVKGFSGNKVTYNKIDDKSKLFRWIISPEASSKLEFLTCILTFECESVASSVGIVKDKTVTYYQNPKKSDFTKDIVLGATVKTDGKTTTKDTSSNASGEGKTCGLFGIELPILMLSGLVFSYRIKRKGKKTKV